MLPTYNKNLKCKYEDCYQINVTSGINYQIDMPSLEYNE